MTIFRTSLSVLCCCVCLVAVAVAEDKVPQSTSDANPPGSKETVVSTALLSGEVVFTKNTFRLSEAGLIALNKLIDDLKEYIEIQSIKVTGHTDSSGPDEYNKKLSGQRARYIKQFFVNAFPNVDIVSIGAGSEFPLVSNDTLEGRIRNRRVEIEVVALGIRP